MTPTCDLSVDWRACPNCARLKERIEDAEQASKVVSANLDRAYSGYREDVAAGRACIATPRQRAWSSYLDDLEMEQSMASSHWREAIDTWAASINEHHRLHEDRQQKAEDSKGVAADTATGMNENTDTDDAMPCTCAMCQAEDGEPLYLCGGFLNAHAERHATVEQHETEEDDVLRDAVRAIEHGETIQILSEWDFGNRHGRRTALRELRELLDDMIASIDDDTEEGV